MKYAQLLIAVFAARFLATAIAFPQVDGDLGWQRWLGASIARTGRIPDRLGSESFSALGAPWVPQEWAFSLAAAAARDGLPWVLFAGTIALAATGALLIAACHARARGGSQVAVALATAFAGIALLASFGVRVQVLSWPLLAGFLLLLDLEGPIAYAAIAIVAVWSNVHASAVLGPALAGIAAIGALVDGRRLAPRVRRLALIAVGSAVATCASPLGVKLPLYAITLFASPFKAYINEWSPTDLGDAAFAYGGFPLLVVAVAVFALREPAPRRFEDLAIVATFTWLMLSAGRNIALFGIVALPYASAGLGRLTLLRDRVVTDERRERIARFAFAGFALVIAAGVTIGLLGSDERRRDTVAAAAVAALPTLAGEHRIFCEDFAWCGNAVGMPRVSVFLDGRADPYPLQVWQDFAAIAGVHNDWRSVVDRRRIDTIIVRRDSPLDQVLARASPWHVDYADQAFRIWTSRAATSHAKN